MEREKSHVDWGFVRISICVENTESVAMMARKDFKGIALCFLGFFKRWMQIWNNFYLLLFNYISLIVIPCQTRLQHTSVISRLEVNYKY